MQTNLLYPTTKELREVTPELIQVRTRNRPTFKYFPITEKRAWRIEWRVKDNSRGLQQLRGINGEPSYVKMVGQNEFGAEPGVFGEYMTIDEKELTQRMAEAREGEPVDVTDLVAEKQDYLNVRELNLIEFIHWSLLLNGQFVVAGPTGAVFADSYDIQEVTLSDWSDLANATPLADLRNLKLANILTTSSDFGARADAWANSVTISHAMNNRNPLDLGGVKLQYGRSMLGLDDMNEIFLAQDVPTLRAYNEGYHRDSDGAKQLWIPNDVVSIVGARPNGEPVGEYRMVRNANNPRSEPGRYEKVIVRKEDRVPPIVEVHRGHNGGPVLFYPGSIIRANV